MTPEQAKWMEAEALKRTGGQAFPVGAASFGPSGDMAFPENGMTLRDWYAGKALAALIGSGEIPFRSDFDVFVNDTATMAYGYADAMLAGRAK